MKPKEYKLSFSRLALHQAAAFVFLASLALLAFPAAAAYPPTPPRDVNPDWKHLGITWRVSVARDGTEGNGYIGQENAISPDGRYVVFASAADNLVPEDTHPGYEDIFLRDNQTGVIERISVSSAGVAANNDCYYGVDVSADGRYVVFATAASNLVSGDTNSKWDVFLRDRQAGTTIRVSVSSSGTQSNGHSWLPRISDDGSTVVYTSEATNLVSGDTNGTWDIFAYNRLTGQTERISISDSEAQGNGEAGDNKAPAVSADGRYVAFTSFATNLVPNDTNNTCDNNSDGNFNENCPDIFVRDRINGTTERVSLSSSGDQGNNFSVSPAISGDGRYVAFYSAASNLVANDDNTCETWYYTSGPCPDVFVRDRTLNTTERVSVSSTGAQSTGSPFIEFKPPAISADGNIVVFTSSDVTLAAGATNGKTQVLAHNRTTHETTLVSASTFGWQGNSWSAPPPDISADGRYVSFHSYASDLVMDDANSLPDIFVRDREGWTYAVAGTVRDEADHPVQNVTVGHGTKLTQYKVTDNNGDYELYYIPAGTVSIKAWAPGYLPATPAERLVTLPPTTNDVDFVIRQATDYQLLPMIKR